MNAPLGALLLSSEQTESAILRRQLEAANKRASDWASKLGTVEAKLAYAERANADMHERLTHSQKRVADLERELRVLQGDDSDEPRYDTEAEAGR